MRKSGCQWRLLPSAFRKWRTCYDYWQKWSDRRGESPSLLEAALKKVVGAARRSRGQDAPSIKNTDTAARKGDDAGKKVSSIKRRIGVDMQGLPPVLHVSTATVADKAGALTAFTRG